MDTSGLSPQFPAFLPLLAADLGPLDGIAPVILTGLALLGVSFCASLTEAAFLALPKIRAQAWAESDKATERLASRIRMHFAEPIATIVVVNNLSNTAGPFLVGHYASEYAVLHGWPDPTVTGIVAASLTLLVILFGEVLPKTLGDGHSEAIARASAYPLRGAQFLFRPLTWLIGLLQKPFARVSHHVTSEEEIGRLAELGEEQGAIEKHESTMIQRVLRLNDITAEQIMTPRVELVMLPAEQKLADAKPELANLRRSLIPLYRKNRDDVVAVLDRMDALLVLGHGKGDLPLTDPLVSVKPYFVPHTMTADKLLVNLQRRTDHLAVVVGEYGETLGVVTLEDVMEEIVGEIYDDEDIGSGTGVQRVSRDEVVAQGASEVKNVNDALGTEVPNHRTVAGLLLDELERIPSKGEIHRAHGVSFEIVDANDRAILKVRIRREKPPVEEGGAPQEDVSSPR
ncbi:MAG: hypothetical protein HMLKMBBP_00597 [Planctomycetes bacterium]|nr:hypothetical protein [Planctomycetota bacterium]